MQCHCLEMPLFRRFALECFSHSGTEVLQRGYCPAQLSLVTGLHSFGVGGPGREAALPSPKVAEHLEC